MFVWNHCIGHHIIFIQHGLVLLDFGTHSIHKAR